MEDLARKYRPHRFADVVGQDPIVAWLREQAASRAGRSVLLSGPYGTGKTTAGLIYAKTLLCETPKNGEACGGCANCTGFGELGLGVSDLQSFKCGERSTVEEIKELLEVARTTPWTANRRVWMLDEIHNLSRRACDALLAVTENPPSWTTFIFLTSKPEALPIALRSRLTNLVLKPLSADLGARFLRSICAAEQLSYEPAGIALVQAAVGGHPREMLFALEKVAEFGAITEANVRVALDLDIVDRLMSYGDELLSGDLGKQKDLIESWIEAPSRKLEFLHRFLVFNYFVSLRRLRRDDQIMRGLTEEFQQKFLQGMATRAGRLKLDEEVFWQNAIAALVPKEHISEHELLMVLARFDRLINPTPISWANPGKHAVAQPAIKKLRVVKDAAPPDDSAGDYLAWEEIRPVWQAGTFLAQHHGALLNLRMTLRHDALGIHDHAAGSRLASDLTHELGMRLQDWGASAERQFHWMLRHEADCDGDLVTRVMMSVPSDHLPAAIHWAGNRFLRRRAGKEASSALLIAYRDGGRSEQRVRFHWACVRALSRSLDPAELGRSQDGRRTPLVDLLRIPRRWRGPTGDVRCPKKRLASESLGPHARRLAAGDQMAFLYALDDGAWRHLDQGWELLEHRDRELELRRRREEVGRVWSLFDGDDALTIARRGEELARLRASYPNDPRKRLRWWDGWWNAPTRVHSRQT